MIIKHLVGPVTELVAVFLGLASYRKLDKGLRWLFYFVCIGFVTDVSINIASSLFDYNYNLTLLHVYVPIEFLLISMTYFYGFNSFYNRKLLLAIIIVFELYCVINPILLQELHGYTNTRSVSGLLLILFSLMYFHKIVIESKVQSLAKEPMIWVNVAVLFYFSGNFFFNILFNQILEHSREYSKLTADIFTVLNGLFYITIAIAFWKAGKKDASGT